jgi:monoamine oxidase
MPQRISRQEYFRKHPLARGWAALDHAENAQMQVTMDPCMPAKDSLNGKHVVIIGSGVGGLTTAYELLSRNSTLSVTILEARDRTGGRCLSLRTGDTLTEDVDSQLYSTPGQSQVVRFARAPGDSEPYLNAGPGRIPSGHKRLLGYLKKFSVAMEVYVMDSSSNLIQTEGGVNGKAPAVYRQLDHNTRGWIAQMVYRHADEMIAETCGKVDCDAAEQLKSLMVSFGQLNSEGQYEVGTAPEGQDETEKSDRAGFDELPGVAAGVIADAIGLDRLLASGFWKKTNFYQPQDFLWQPTLFQPVGGMDQVQHAFVQQVAMLGGVIHINCPVTSIDYDTATGQYLITGAGHADPFRADYCFSNAAIPFLEKVLSPGLQDASSEGGFNKQFKDALHAVYTAQANNEETKRFLACTTKVGWQADRDLWQGKPITTHKGKHGYGVLAVAPSELGVVPIYGGISRTDNPITQIWYPSTGYHDKLGVLTGCYNYTDNAAAAGNTPIPQRLANARAGAALFGADFAAGLNHGVAIAWQNMPWIKGGWAQWQYVDGDRGVTHYNQIIQGTGVNGSAQPTFFVVGDQVSSLPGWQEGAIASALNAISRLVQPGLKLAHLKNLPDTHIMVEGL